MGCCVVEQNATKVAWFKAAVENDIETIQLLKSQCAGQFQRSVGLSALHLAVIYSSEAVVKELLPLEIYLKTKQSVTMNGNTFGADASIVHLSTICNNYSICTIILDYFVTLDIQNIRSFTWFLNNVQAGCVSLVTHKFFRPQLTSCTASKEHNVLVTVQNQALYQYLLDNFNYIPQQFSVLLKDLFLNYLDKFIEPIQRKNNKKILQILKELQKLVENEQELLVKQQFGGAAGSKFLYLTTEGSDAAVFNQ
ncbi:Ankyrin_repeat-containing domain superfamily [Hexamita inflata]|uniref:Ankyrin repeat-containing domain superfamily n=1 Tax=Hexamita inflata TaxID=28002 RepID=A0AA86TRC3_9EUKA|nr:Ankyrin repeat-containing domain superfamily [Hexamita inflata]